MLKTQHGDYMSRAQAHGAELALAGCLLKDIFDPVDYLQRVRSPERPRFFTANFSANYSAASTLKYCRHGVPSVLGCAGGKAPPRLLYVSALYTHSARRVRFVRESERCVMWSF